MERSIRRLAGLLLLSLVAIALTLTYWQVIRSQELVYGPYNPRLLEEEKQTARGRILDRTGRVLAYSEQTDRGMERRYSDPTTAPITGYYSTRYGASGLESSFARYLRGDVQANPIDTLVNQALHRPSVGADLHLTLDPRVQAAAAQAMGSDRGAIVALDPRTGAVLAMVSTPYFDPNRIDEGWSGLQGDPAEPLYNRATMGLYTPGSVFKIVTASAAIDLGLVDLDKRYQCTEDLTVDGFVIQNKNHPGVSDVTFVDDFAYSCNVTFARVGLGLGSGPLPLGDQTHAPAPRTRDIGDSRQRFLDYAARFGLEGPLPFDIPTSASRVGNRELSRVELANTAFGQGDLQVTPLLMALASATVANDGKMPQPYLVSEIRDRQGNLLQSHSPRILREVISQDSAGAMNRLMVASVQEGYARTAAIPGLRVGGKTGSAEVGPGLKTHSWFIGYAPADDPVVAVAVIMENKGPGSDFAAPAGRKVMEAALGR
ncbi:MAG: peptidoglycan D,D-transpeptidase FtsI family protein [Chloroflexota bacterium]